MVGVPRQRHVYPTLFQFTGTFTLYTGISLHFLGLTTGKSSSFNDAGVYQMYNYMCWSYQQFSNINRFPGSSWNDTHNYVCTLHTLKDSVRDTSLSRVCGLKNYYYKLILFKLLQILYLLGVSLLLTFDLLACVDSTGMHYHNIAKFWLHAHTVHELVSVLESWEFVLWLFVKCNTVHYISDKTL